MPRRSAKARSRALRARAAAVFAAAAAALGVVTACQPLPPQVIASTGDSIARGFDACGLLSECTQISYATGSAPSSGSLYRRLLAHDSGLTGHDYNDAEVGARSYDMYGQLALAAWQKADVVTVLIGANDACAPTVGDMTQVPTFRAAIEGSLRQFFSNRPGARVVLSSIPDLYRVWQVAHTLPRARAVWQAAHLCPSLLANPLSTAKADVLGRYFVWKQIENYNAALASVCAEFSGCRWDGGAVGRYQFSLSELSPYDYFHPNPAGHRALAGLVWNAYNASA